MRCIYNYPLHDNHANNLDSLLLEYISSEL